MMYKSANQKAVFLNLHRYNLVTAFPSNGDLSRGRALHVEPC